MRYIYGAGGHARVVLGICESANLPVDAFLEQPLRQPTLGGIPCFEADKISLHATDEVIIAIGDNRVRRKLSASIPSVFFKAIHSSAIIDRSATLGAGAMICPGVVINADVRIGDHVIINTSSVIEHNCEIADFAHISPNATLCGNVRIGSGTHIGAGAVIVPGINIGSGCVIGAGTVVIRDIPDHSLVVGNPGRLVRSITASE